MKTIKSIIIFAFVCAHCILSAQTKTLVNSFNEATISPHIETTFIEGEEESVTILESSVPKDKINIEVKNNELSVYLEGAKAITKNKKVYKDGQKRKESIYKGKVLTIQVTYKNLKKLILCGEEKTLCKSALKSDHFDLQIFGDNQVVLNEVQFNEFSTEVFGESELIIKSGKVHTQSITAFGESHINLVEVASNVSKITSFGEAEFTVNCSDQIKFSAFGEAKLNYKGTATVKKGITLGDTTITAISN